jgi:hypothetical protein
MGVITSSGEQTKGSCSSAVVVKIRPLVPKAASTQLGATLVRGSASIVERRDCPA